jgi:uncharacterized protein YfaA (DUF2138 family)
MKKIKFKMMGAASNSANFGYPVRSFRYYSRNNYTIATQQQQIMIWSNTKYLIRNGLQAIEDNSAALRQ